MLLYETCYGHRRRFVSESELNVSQPTLFLQLNSNLTAPPTTGHGGGGRLCEVHHVPHGNSVALLK